jgi:hypothetical protein
MLSLLTASLNNQLKKQSLNLPAGRVVLMEKFQAQKNGEFIFV